MTTFSCYKQYKQELKDLTRIRQEVLKLKPALLKYEIIKKIDNRIDWLEEETRKNPYEIQE